MEQTEQKGFWEDAEVIHRYTREQAIADGVLVDVSATAREAGFTVPVALTAAVSADLNHQGDREGRLWDLLWMGRLAARRGGQETLYTLIMPVGRKKRYTAKLHVGPGDTGEPVITILRPDED